MFFLRLIQIFLGYIKFRVDGASCEKFLNLVSRAGIVLWNIRRDKTGLYANVLLSKYKTAEQLAKKAGVKLTIVKQGCAGIPYKAEEPARFRVRYSLVCRDYRIFFRLCVDY